MPRVFRSMKEEGGKPKVGNAAMMLGVRRSDVSVDESGNVHPKTGGMSVNASLRSMPARLVPKRLKDIVPGAAGNNNLRVWAMGGGSFESGGFADHLNLRLDEEDPLHGLIEPDAIMGLQDYE